MKKRALILALAGIMAASLIGCGSRKDDAVVVKAGDEEIMHQTARHMKSLSRRHFWMI